MTEPIALQDESIPAVRWMRAPEAARILGLSLATLAKLRTVGGGPRFSKFGRAVVYESAELHRWGVSKRKQRSTRDTDTNA